MTDPCSACPIPAERPCPYREHPGGCPAATSPNIAYRARLVAKLARMMDPPDSPDSATVGRVVTCPHRECECHSVRAFAVCRRESMPMPTDYELCMACKSEPAENT